MTVRIRSQVGTDDESATPVLTATAHELRLPLSHIKGCVASLRRTDVNLDEETQSEFLEQIENEADRLTQLVDSLCTRWSVLHEVRGLVRERPVQVVVPRWPPPAA